MTNFTLPNNMSSMKYALKSAPGLADVGVSYGDGPRTLAPGSGSKIRAYHVDQCEKRKRLDDKKSATFLSNRQTTMFNAYGDTPPPCRAR